MNKTHPLIAIVIPCYNEEEVLPISIPEILQLLDSMMNQGEIDAGSFILCCDDGSQDSTWSIISSMHRSDQRVKGISLAHNRGHQNTLMAGLMTVRSLCDAAITIDADLQDAPEAMKDMIGMFKNGRDIVYGVRNDRSSDPWFKRTSARMFYKFQNNMGLETVYDHADYRLLSRRALELLSEYTERNLFLRGLIPQLGLSSGTVYYSRSARAAGKTKYPLVKMLNFSIDGITSFTSKPIRFIFITGLIFLILDLLVGIWVLMAYFTGSAISGWPSIMLSIWFLGSLILMSIGIVGEYIGKIFIEVKRRPLYAIKETMGL